MENKIYRNETWLLKVLVKVVDVLMLNNIAGKQLYKYV